MVISNGVGEMRWIMCEGKLPRSNSTLRSVTSFTHELFILPLAEELPAVGRREGELLGRIGDGDARGFLSCHPAQSIYRSTLSQC